MLPTKVDCLPGTQISFQQLLDLRLVRYNGWEAHALNRRSTSEQTNRRTLGTGIDYAETREWSHGDEVRHIDWRVTSRFGKLHTKVFDVPADQSVTLIGVFDPACTFGVKHATKAVAIAQLLALECWNIPRNANSIAAQLIWPWGVEQLTAMPVPQARQNLLRRLVQGVERLHKVEDTHPESTDQPFTQSLCNALRSVVHNSRNATPTMLIAAIMPPSTDYNSLLTQLSACTPLYYQQVLDRLDIIDLPYASYGISSSNTSSSGDARDTRTLHLSTNSAPDLYARRRRWRESALHSVRKAGGRYREWCVGDRLETVEN